MPLLDALRRRRSSRVARGLRLDSGPLTFASELPAQPLTLDEEAALAFAANGVTGYARADLPFQPGESGGGGGNVMIHLVGRTVASGDAAHAVALFVLNDDGSWFLRRPQDYPRSEIADLVARANTGHLRALYERSRVRISERRVDIPRQVPFVPTFNQWSSNQPGSTLFLPMADLTGFYINVMLAAFSREPGVLMLDERNRYRPAGVGKYARRKGGHLNDDPASGLVGTIGLAETWLLEFAAIEQGMMLQNLGLMAAALDVGGFVHFAAHPYAWPEALGFRMHDVPFSRSIGANRATRLALRALRRDLPIPTPLGLTHDGAALLKPFCPPWYPTMRDAVLAFVDYKFASATGTMRDATAMPWRDPSVQAGIPSYDDATIAATIDYCEYVHARYGRFPATTGPFRTVMAYQAHHLDPAFYRQFYRPGTGPETTP